MKQPMNYQTNTAGVNVAKTAHLKFLTLLNIQIQIVTITYFFLYLGFFGYKAGVLVFSIFSYIKIILGLCATFDNDSCIFPFNIEENNSNVPIISMKILKFGVPQK